VISFGSHFESTVLCLASLVELGASYVVARAETQRQVGILKQLGAARVLQLEQDMGERFADELITPVTRELLEVAEHYRVLPWSVSGPLVGNSLAEARLRQRYDINVIGYRRRGEGMPADTTPRLHIPTGDYVLAEGDSLLIVGEEDNVARFVEEVGD
jgi:trk system potassium uptake protein TrkA